ncbi:MAG TPA: hypothetical protein VH107_11920, partial [Lacipirellulaceae bacterium]|nr:hypothetical protein [Lacipirellulaceae bacterium]
MYQQLEGQTPRKRWLSIFPLIVAGDKLRGYVRSPGHSSRLFEEVDMNNEPLSVRDRSAVDV